MAAFLRKNKIISEWSGFAPQKYEHFALIDEETEKIDEGFPCVSDESFGWLRKRCTGFRKVLRCCVRQVRAWIWRLDAHVIVPLYSSQSKKIRRVYFGEEG